MAIAAQELSAGHGRRVVLRGVNATARNGAITVVVGANAAGKTTLLRTLVGALRPIRGAATIDGRPASRWRGAALAERVAFVPQRPTIFAPFTAREAVALGRWRLAAAPERLDAALGDMDLLEDADRPVPALSAGQQQRVALARALAQVDAAGHLVLDEPLAALDLRHARALVRVLRERAAAGAAVLLSLHDLATAAAIADDAWLIDGGALVEGAAEEILRPATLEAVFGVPFRLLPGAEGDRARLLPEWTTG